MPTLRPRNRASASSSRAPSSWPATTTVPESGRSRPAMTISRVDFPEPDGPTMPTASPRPILRSMSLRMWTRAAPRPSDRLTPASAIAGLFLAGVARAADAPIKIVALGDSLTAGYNLPASAAFPVKLERALRAKGHVVEVANAGVSGDTASGGLARLDWSVPDGTTAVIVELGANDMLRGVDPKVPQRAQEEI